jgi:hypothetical protein
METNRKKFHTLLKEKGLNFTTKNIDGLGTKLSNDFTDIYLLCSDVPLLESICKDENRECMWPVVGTYSDKHTIRRVVLWR